MNARVDEKARCIACGGEIVLFGPRLSYTYYRCESCGSIQLFPMPGEQDLAEAYRSSYVDAAHTQEFADPEVWRTVSKPYCKSVADAVQDQGVRGTVVDYGAGWGFLVELMTQYGLQARGVELSQAEVAYARGRGLPIEEGDLSAIRALEGEVSAITMLAVFEHLVNHDKVLREAHQLLTSRGFLVTLHPTAAAFNLIGNVVRLGNKRKQLPDLAGAFTPPWHTVLFSIEGTRRVFARCGFELLEIRPAPQGRLGGVLGLIQRVLEFVNKLGWRLFGLRWPLLTTHIFIFQKTEQTGGA